MEISMKPKITRFSQTSPGDLFMFSHREGLSIALTASDPTTDYEKIPAVLGPSFPQGKTGPSIIQIPGSTLISFEKNYELRLPSDPSGWSIEEPPAETHCLVVANPGNVFLRCDFSRYGDSQFCFVNVETGEIEANQSRGSFIRPSGYLAFAIRWQILTTETEPRSILSFPR
jgi:hypothetical protein